MFGRIKRGWGLTKASFGVLRADKEIALLPVLSAVVLVLTVGPLAGGGVLLTGLREGAEPGPAHYALALIVYVVGYFVTIYFNAAVVACARIRFEGRDPTLRDGLAKAWERKLPIIQWSLVAATVGMIIRALRRRADGIVDRLILGGIGLAWNAASYFVVPVIVETGAGPIDALRDSGATIRETWGEAFAGEAGAGFVFLLMGLGLLVVALAPGLIVGSGTLLLAGLVVLLVGGVLLAVSFAAVDGILKAALYRYAETGEVPSGFTQDAFPEAATSPEQSGW
jgi:hypothetical protein